MKRGTLAWCGVLVSTAAYAQTPPDPAGAPAPGPTPAPAPPPDGEPEHPATQGPEAQPPVVVQPAVAAPVQQETGGEVEERYRNAGLLFNLNNVFVQPGVLGGWQGFGLGMQKKLGSGSTMRLGVELARVTDPVNIVKTTRTNGMDVVTSYDVQLPGSGFSAQHGATAVVDIIKPLTERTIAPYLGGGVFASWANRSLAYTDDLTITDQITEVDNSSTNVALGLRGIVGVGWRLNERFSLFAEYHLSIEAIAWQSDHTSTTTNNTAAPGEPASSRVETEFRETRYFNLDLGLGQGGALGLVAHF